MLSSESSARQEIPASGNGRPAVPDASGEVSRAGRPRSRPRRLAQWLTAGAVLASALAAWFLSRTAPLQSLELKTYDLRFVLHGPQTAPAGIFLVMIDEDTEAAYLEPQVFWHPHYAALLRAAAQGGARAIGLDVTFAISVEQWMPDIERQLGEAFAEVSATTPVVVAFERLSDELSPPAPDLPLYLLASTQGAMGFTNLMLDDGFVRRQELLSKDDPPWESFAARLAALSLNAEWQRPGPMQSGLPPRRLLLDDRAVPLDSDGAMRIRFWGPKDTFPSASMEEVLRAADRQDNAALQGWFQGNVVLIGTAHPSDQQSTPFYSAAGGQGLTPGVEIHASTLATLLEERFLQELPVPWSMALVLAAAALAALCIVKMRFPVGPLVLIAVVAGYLALSVAALEAGAVLPVVPVVMAAALSGLTSYGAQALTEGRQKRLLQEVFGRYVSTEVASELLEYGEVPLGGTRQPVTVMFTDLRGYTGYCQGRDPHQVVRELNEYFAEMSEEIKAHGGMINKFIGDGIMALFGAPLPHPDDARRAVACALKMVERNEAFNRRRVADGLPPLVVGIGIHTGDVVVGNIGAPEKMEYTAIGDTVNVAARIESENKTFGTRLLISEATWQQVTGHVAAEAAGSAQMKGIEEPMTLYKVIGVE